MLLYNRTVCTYVCVLIKMCSYSKDIKQREREREESNQEIFYFKYIVEFLINLFAFSTFYALTNLYLP